MTILIRGGTVLTPDGPAPGDVLVVDGTVAAVGSGLEAASAEVVDAAGCWVGPGLVDLHVHLREPGEEWKEDVASGSASAAAGGFTAVVAMPNTIPAVDVGHIARFVAERGRAVGIIDVVPAGAVTLARNGERLARLDELWAAGVRVFSDDGTSIADAGLLRSAMEHIAERGGVIAQHAEDAGLSAGGHMHEGMVSSRLGMTGIPALAEEVVVARDLALVRLTGCRYHVQHVSTAGTVDLVRRAKAEGLPVTAEVTPHHLTFSEESVHSMSPAYKMYPPLRAAADLAAVRAGLADGTIDAVATDHAPHAVHECEVPFEEAPRGIIGLETAVAAVVEAGTGLGMGIVEVFDRMSVRPARIAGLERHGRFVTPGAPANITVVDPAAEWTATSFRSRAMNSPWLGRRLRGRVRATVFEGKVTFQVEST